MSAACISCRRLGRCETTDTEKVLADFLCDRYQEVEAPEQTQARRDIIAKYGETGAAALVSQREET